MKHYNEVELLEHYYLSAASPEVGDHVGGCTECAARYERLREKLSCSAESHRQHVDAKPETFWLRQRHAISNQLERRVRRQVAFAAPWRFAVAAMLALLLGTAVFVAVHDQDTTQQVARDVVETEGIERDAGDLLNETEALVDPWAEKELQPYAEVVEWESWLTEKEGEGTS